MNPAMTRLTPTAVAELRTLSPRVLSGLPLATELRLKLPGQSALTTFRVAGRFQGSDADATSFDVDEVVAIADAVEHGRASADDVVRWCQQKATDAAFRVTADVALAGIAPPPITCWSLDAVLGTLDAVIVEAAIEDDRSQLLPVAA